MGIKELNKIIEEKINLSENGILFKKDININSIFSYVDVAIFDNSSVLIDYLITNKPFIITRTNNFFYEPKILKVALILEIEHLPDIFNIVKNILKTQDLSSKIRKELCNYYHGQLDYSKQESTKLFISTVKTILEEQVKCLKEKELK